MMGAQYDYYEDVALYTQVTPLTITFYGSVIVTLFLLVVKCCSCCSSQCCQTTRKGQKDSSVTSLGYIKAVESNHQETPVQHKACQIFHKIVSYVQESLLKVTLAVAHFLYGDKSIQVKANKLKYKYRCLKINGSYYKLSLLSILPIVWCNINIINISIAIFIRTLVKIQLTTNTTCILTDAQLEMSCFNVTNSNNSLLTSDGCSLLTEYDQIDCYQITYHPGIAVGVIGSFLLTVPRIAFGTLTWLYSLTYDKKHLPAGRLSLSCVSICTMLLKFFINICIPFSGWFFYFLSIILIRILRREEMPLTITVLIASMFLSCPFSIMNSEFRRKVEVKFVPEKEDTGNNKETLPLYGTNELLSLTDEYSKSAIIDKDYYDNEMSRMKLFYQSI